MAVRIHVTAVRARPADEVRATFVDALGPPFEAVPVHEHGGWSWFHTSVWGVGAGDLNAGLCRLARPALQFTTSDGSRWYLTVHGGPDGREAFLHEFGYFSGPASDEDEEDEDDDGPPEIDPELAFLEDEPEAPSRPRVPFDGVVEHFDELGAPIPEPVRDRLRELPYREAVDGLRDWHADAVVAALERAGIPVDRPAVRRALLWEGVTEGEHGSDLGNLPRLLSALGLGGEWDDIVRKSDASPSGWEEDDDEEGPEESEPEPTPDQADRVLGLVSSLPMTPIEGGPVPVRTTRLARLGFPAEACSAGESPMMLLVLRPPDGDDRARDLAPPEPSPEVQLDFGPVGVRLGLPDRGWYCGTTLRSQVGRPMTRFLGRPPDGTAVDVAFAVPDQPATYHRFAGTVRDGALLVDRSHPPLSAETLADAVELAGGERRSAVRCRDEAEAEAVLAEALREPFFRNVNARRKGRIVRVDFDSGQLARLALRLRHRDSWDFRPAEEHAAREAAERAARMRQLRRDSARSARERAAPHDPEVLLRGEHSVYWRSDLLRLDQLDPEPRRRFEAAMAALGFSPVGDLVAKIQRDIVLRAFLSADRLCFGILMAKRTMYMGHEFVSRLEDGSGLTTTTNAMVDSVPRAGIYYRTFPGLEPEALHAKHREGLDRFRTRKGVSPAVLDDTLVGVAREIEIALARRKRAEQLDREADGDDD